MSHLNALGYHVEEVIDVALLYILTAKDYRPPYRSPGYRLGSLGDYANLSKLNAHLKSQFPAKEEPWPEDFHLPTVVSEMYPPLLEMLDEEHLRLSPAGHDYTLGKLVPRIARAEKDAYLHVKARFNKEGYYHVVFQPDNAHPQDCFAVYNLSFCQVMTQIVTPYVLGHAITGEGIPPSEGSYEHDDHLWYNGATLRNVVYTPEPIADLPKTETLNDSALIDQRLQELLSNHDADVATYRLPRNVRHGSHQALWVSLPEKTSEALAAIPEMMRARGLYPWYIPLKSGLEELFKEHYEREQIDLAVIYLPAWERVEAREKHNKNTEVWRTHPEALAAYGFLRGQRPHRKLVAVVDPLVSLPASVEDYVLLDPEGHWKLHLQKKLRETE